MKDIRAQFQKNGYVILEDFFQPEEIEELRACGEEFTNKLPPESERKVFNTIQLQQNKDKYFLDSANKISLFFESEALEEDGKLKVHPRVSLNKVMLFIGYTLLSKSTHSMKESKKLLFN
ncbi:Phytanoyl-CoA dioxygenase domain-containing protein 1 like protein [Trachymyrmex cornetzi]|uniref:Phytanoyl-CoA dioxygenase domain-containing protein 1 like protein n=1 Tax=Trachymyrmex cornetzi TaxID=471704 RepID=A0A151J3W0_9HYME|nr:Phytanoyl-CoA dioxygenase domain-containing protein 1 like protein [Trachymyrmex cornetzi]